MLGHASRWHHHVGPRERLPAPDRPPALLTLTWNRVPILRLGVLPRRKPEQVRGDDQEAFWGGNGKA